MKRNQLTENFKKTFFFQFKRKKKFCQTQVKYLEWKKDPVEMAGDVYFFYFIPTWA